MRNLTSYLPIALQVSILIIGYLFINTGLAIENNNQSYVNFSQELTLSTSKSIEKNSITDIIANNEVSYNPKIIAKEIIETTDLEDEQLIEKWMIEANGENWKTNLDETSTIETDEEEMPLEEWMTDLSSWNK